MENRFTAFIKKLQGLPDNQKKLIFLVAIACVALVAGFIGFIDTKNQLASFGGLFQSIPLPNINISDLPSIVSNTDVLSTVSDEFQDTITDQGNSQ